ncbi:MAG TPA: hypothetical protein VFV92_08935, partial [Candidatus Bathyarchaeia archaeon]|nr:hypothetical protein [Candidatus Bathyarchaeia archaeon]
FDGMKRSDDRIRELCSRIRNAKGEQEVVRLCLELRKAIQGHVEHFRSRAAAYPVATERRRPTKE